MTEYSDPEKNYSLEYPEGWLPLTHEGSPHVSLASLTTGGYLKIEAYHFDQPNPDDLRPEKTLRALLECEQCSHPELDTQPVRIQQHAGMALAYSTFTRKENKSVQSEADFGHARAWVYARGCVQVRCLYRCHSSDAGVDDEEIDSIINTLIINDEPHLDAGSFTSYYYSLLKHQRPQLAIKPPQGLTLTLSDGQTILLEHLFNHYLREPAHLDDLIESHIGLLDFCGDDVPDLTNFKQIQPLLFPKLFRAASSALPPHRIKFWPGLCIGAVVQGSVFNYGVNTERLKNWGFNSLNDIKQDLIDALYRLAPIAPRGLRDKEGETQAISYVDHPFSASFVLYGDFYDTTAHNLGAQEFLVGLPDPSCASCFRDEDPRFVVQHTAMLRWDYHRSVERLTDTIYLVTGPMWKDVRPYDILHCCAKKA